jgi:hypothetical protein
MDRRWLASIGAAGVVTAIAVAAAVPVLGQAGTGATKKPPAATSSGVPRTPDGHPDLTGVWDFATVTPMERPKELADKAQLSEKEAAEFEARSAQRNNRDFNVPAGNVGDYNNFWYDRGTKVLGSKRTSLIVDPPDGRIPPLTPEAQKRVAAAAEARRGVGIDEPTPGGFVNDLGSGGLRVRCILGFNSGPPMTPGAYNNNIQVVQTSDYLAILNEMIHNARIVPLDGRPHGHVRQWVGDSRGRWEGDTLVIDTTNFLRETLFEGSSANLHLVERFTRVDLDTLRYEFTVEDPMTWTRPWTAQILMAKSQGLVYEYACHEGNYGIYDILAGARARDDVAEEAAKKGPR